MAEWGTGGALASPAPRFFIVTIHCSADGKTWERFGTRMEVSGYHHDVAHDFLSLRPAIYASALSRRVRDLFAAPDNEVYLSAVSAWEIAVKHGLGRLPSPDSPDKFVREMRDGHGISPLPIDEESAPHVSRLPALHQDPFDRMLVSQAIVHGLTILTPDTLVTQYPGRTIW
jgi:PIN domain nuclease of toxin-antitoxin system